MKIIPRKDYILVKPEPVTDKVSEFGIVSPDNVEQDRKAIGDIIEVGCDVQGLKKGDKVIFGVYGGEEVSFTEKGKKIEYKILKDEDVIAILQ